MTTAKQKKDADSAKSTAVAITSFSDEDLRGLKSFSDAFAAAEERYGSVVDAADFLGSGFTLLKGEEKAQLVGKPFIVLESRFHPGDYASEYASIVLMTQADERFILNDGGSGICADVQQMQALTNRNGGWLIKGGLRVSEYATCGKCSLPRPAEETECEDCGDKSDKRGKGVTYYLAP